MPTFPDMDPRVLAGMRVIAEALAERIVAGVFRELHAAMQQARADAAPAPAPEIDYSTEVDGDTFDEIWQKMAALGIPRADTEGRGC